MNLTIESLNLWGARALDFAWPVLWQSSLLIGLLFALDFALRRRVRAAVRYALWLVVLLKLLLPPALALPTGLGWWLRPTAPAPAKLPAAAFTVSYGPAVAPAFPEPVVPVTVAPARPTLSSAAWALMVSSGASLGLLAWMLLRWRQVACDVRQAGAAPEPLRDLLEEARLCVGLRQPVRLGLTERPMSPAVCGLFRPRILLPRSLAEQLPPAQLRAILVHELIHLRRGDVWANCAQALLQLLYWWHPLLWLANARIRQAREEAVDDAVMAALREEAEAYAPTLLEVARLALQRPLTSLGLVGILESRHSLRQRIQRLLDFHPPRKAGLTLVSAVLVLAFAAVAVPMGEAPAPTEAQASTAAAGATNSPVSGPATNAPLAKSKHSVSLLVRDGMLFYQMGKLDEANATLKQALALDPQNQAARYYSNLVAEAKRHDALLGTQMVRRKGRQALLNKLNSIRLDDVSFQASTLGEALPILNREIKERDPDKRGINFIVVLGTNSPGTPGADLASTRIALKPSSTQQTLADVLNELVKSAERPLKYSVEEYAVVFSARQEDQEVAPLFTRRYKLNPGSFFAGLHAATGLATNADWQERTETLRNFFAAKGAELEPPKRLYYNETEGRLYVRAEEQDLEIIEEVIQELNSAPATNGPPAAPEAGAPGFPGYLGMTNASGAPSAPAAPATGTNTASTPPLSFQWILGPTNAGPVTNTSPQIHIKAAFLEVSEAAAQAFLARFSVTNAPGSNLWSTTLTPAQAVEERAQWESGANVTVLASPEVTLLSGRRCQMKHVDLNTVVTGFTNGVPQTMTVELGPILDCTPALQADGYTIQLAPRFSLNEFLGYTNPAVRGQFPGPEFRHRELFTSNSAVRDGQTLVLGGLVSEQVTSVKDKVPVLGDLPLVGKLFRSQSSSTHKSHLFILITPTLVTPEGFPVHPEGKWAK